jgi:hypothetical protein
MTLVRTWGYAPRSCASSRAVTAWHGGAAEAKALIVDDGRCALIGGYGAERDRVLVGAGGHDRVT